jgi:hypothetical protein
MKSVMKIHHVVLTFFFALFLAATPVNAQPLNFISNSESDGLGEDVIGILWKLNLTDSQMTDALRLIAAYKTDSEDYRTKLQEAQDTLQKLIYLNTDSEGSTLEETETSTTTETETNTREELIRSAWQNVAAIKEELTVLKASTIDNIKALLTADQVIVFDAEVEKMLEREAKRKELTELVSQMKISLIEYWLGSTGQ